MAFYATTLGVDGWSGGFSPLAPANEVSGSTTATRSGTASTASRVTSTALATPIVAASASSAPASRVGSFIDVGRGGAVAFIEVRRAGAPLSAAVARPTTSAGSTTTSSTVTSAPGDVTYVQIIERRPVDASPASAAAIAPTATAHAAETPIATPTASPTASSLPAVGAALPAPTVTSTPVGAPTRTPTATNTPIPSFTPPPVARQYPQTGYRITNDAILDFFYRRGGLTTFGYPTSRTIHFQGFTVQFFQRRIIQLDQQGQARLVNLLDPGFLPYTSFNGSSVPAVDPGLVASAPPPTNAAATLAYVQQLAPDQFGDAPVNFFQTFLSTVPAQVAFPQGGDPGLLPGIELEMWGIPTSQALPDPNNGNFIYLRWQRGIMVFDRRCNCTQGVLLADYLKAIMTGEHLPQDVDQVSRSSAFFRQYDSTRPRWVRIPSLLPDTDLTDAFTPDCSPSCSP